jgi:multidrug efflux system membrane fusion protein
MNTLRSLAAVLVAATLLAGCAKEPTKAEPVRPVRTAEVRAGGIQEWTLSGEVRARHETRLAFRLPGQMLERRVEVGQRLAAGQVIAVLDSRDVRLAESSARAQLAQAESQAALAEADLKRFTDLRERNFISQAEFDRRAAQAKQAREQVLAARALAMQAANQVGYTLLTAPHAGVVTALEAEAGQVLAAGQTVARLARTEELEVAVSVPEHRLHEFSNGVRYEIRTWADPERRYGGRLRELSPVADPASRTYAARISVLEADPRLALGMTAELRIRGAVDTAPRLPVSALFHRDGRPAVWVVREERVALVAVRTGELSGNLIEITEGLAPGQRVVVAGVNRLEPGQRVALLEEPGTAERGSSAQSRLASSAAPGEAASIR